MSDVPPPPPVADAAPLAVVELDAFCERCGFNLRSQKVWRDERLGLLICRCPECGQHQSAAGRATMVTPWLHRAAMLATLAWVLAGLAFVVALVGVLFATHALANEGFSNRWMEAADGTPVTYGGFDNGKQQLAKLGDPATTLPAGVVTIMRKRVSWLGGPSIAGAMYLRETTWQAAALVGGLSVAGLYACGAILASACWFWRRGRIWAWLALPPLVAIVVAGLIDTSNEGNYYLSDYTVRYDHRLEFAIVVITMAAQMLVIGLGLRTGRSLARGILTTFAPPGVRQLFAFLWHRDGRTMPPARATSDR